MSQRTFDIGPCLHQHEGRHFDRKSLFEEREGEQRPRDRRAVRDPIAEDVAGFANSKGGMLALGIADDHAVTGHAFPAETINALLVTTRSRVLSSFLSEATNDTDRRRCSRIEGSATWIEGS